MRKLLGAFGLMSLGFVGCQQSGPSHMYAQDLAPVHTALVEVASSSKQWTGVAVSHAGRIFVCYPRWSDDVPVSVAELKATSDWSRELHAVAYPDGAWQGYKEGGDVGNNFVCVQSVVVDDADNLWILDAGAPKMGKPVEGGAKLLKIDLKSNSIVAKYGFDASVVTEKSYLNDVRVDVKKQVAYLTDSGNGAIVVLDLGSGKARRVLTEHASTDNEHLAIMIDGKTWEREGKVPYIDSDGIALSADGNWLYYKALSGATLYRIETRFLNDASLSEADLGKHVQSMGRIGATDGLEFDRNEAVFYTDLTRHAVSRFYREGGLDQTEVLAQDPLIQWPDSMAIGPDGGLYFTTSQINLGPNPVGAYRLFKVVSTRK